jgi:hypothetical protein
MSFYYEGHMYDEHVWDGCRKCQTHYDSFPETWKTYLSSPESMAQYMAGFHSNDHRPTERKSA